MTHQRFWTALAFCVLSTLPLVSPARAEHAYAMVCCSVPSSVSVIATATHKTAATLVAGLGSSSAALTADGGTVYVANQNAQSISVLDTATGSAITTISLSAYGASPYGVVLSPDGTRLYVAAVQNGGISVLGITTASYSALFDVATPGAAEGNLTPIPVPPPVISSDGQTVYLLAGSLIAFNTNTFASATLSFNPGSSHPQGVALTPDNAYALVTFNEGRAFSDNSGQFALVDLSTFTVVQQISFPESVTVGAVVGSPDGSLAYFPANSSGKVAVEVFDIASGAVVDTFPAGAGGGGPIAITPDGSEIELGVANEVLSINASTGALIARTGTPGEMVSLTVSADGTAIYVPNFNSSMLEIVDPATSQITGQIPSGWTGAVYDTSYTMQVSAGGRRAAVMGAGSLSIVNTETPALIQWKPGLRSDRSALRRRRADPDHRHGRGENHRRHQPDLCRPAFAGRCLVERRDPLCGRKLLSNRRKLRPAIIDHRHRGHDGHKSHSARRQRARARQYRPLRQRRFRLRRQPGVFAELDYHRRPRPRPAHIDHSGWLGRLSHRPCTQPKGVV
ncbi:MAG: YncE family protein [Bryobacteraceae bacterium]